MKQFESEIVSSKGTRFKIELHADSYIGLDAEIIGGTGNTYYLKGDWTDYLEQDQWLMVFGATNIPDNAQAFLYNEAQDRTEVTVYNVPYNSTRTFLKNDITEQGNFIPVFSPRIHEIVTDYDQEGDMILAPMKTSSTSCSYYNEHAWFDRFFEKYKYSNDEELKLVIYRQVNSSYELEWAGNIVVDLVEWDNISKPTSFTFKAIDGIDKLKDVTYDEVLTNPSNRKLIDVVIELLAKNNLSSFWGSSDPYIRESTEYKSEDVTNVSTSDSLFDYTRIPDQLFIKKNNKSEREAMTCYDALKGVLELCSARIFMAKGCYYIQQVRNFDNSLHIPYKQFTKNGGTPSSGSILNHKKTAGGPDRSEDLVVLGGGKFGYFAGLLFAETTAISHNQVMIETAGVFKEILVGGTYNRNETVNLGRVSGGVGNGATMRIEMDILERTNKYTGSYFNAFNVSINVIAANNPNIYLKGSPTIPPYWGDDAVATQRYWYKKVQGAGGGTRTKLVFETPEIPFDEDNISLLINFATGGPDNDPPKGFIVSNLKIYFPIDGAEEPELEIKVENVNSNFTKALQLDPLLITDMSNTTSINTLEVDENYKLAAATNYVESNLWNAGFDTEEPLSFLRVMEAMSMQFRPIQKIMGSFEGDYYGFNSISYDGLVYCFNGFRYKYAMDEYEGEWFEVATARSGVSGGGIIVYGGGGVGDTTGGGEDGQFRGDLFQQVAGISSTTLDVEAGLVSQIEIEAAPDGKLLEGDTITLLEPISYQVLAEFVVDATVSENATTVQIAPQNITEPIVAGVLVVHKKDKLKDAEIIRGESFQHRGTATVPLTASDMKENEIRFVAGRMYVRNGTELFVVDGTLVE